MITTQRLEEKYISLLSNSVIVNDVEAKSSFDLSQQNADLGYVMQSYFTIPDTAVTVTDKAVDITVPTDNSQLANGAGYLVANDIANKADKATTLEGYGIADAYTSAQTDTAIANAVGQFVEASEEEINAMFPTA